jgi:hypothetical protein
MDSVWRGVNRRGHGMDRRLRGMGCWHFFFYRELDRVVATCSLYREHPQSLCRSSDEVTNCANSFYMQSAKSLIRYCSEDTEDDNDYDDHALLGIVQLSSLIFSYVGGCAV